MASIFIVDDQPHMRELLEGELSEEGHHITCVGDSDYVLSSLEAVSYTHLRAHET